MCPPTISLHPLLAVPTFPGSEWSGHEVTQQSRPCRGLSLHSHPAGRAARLMLPDAYQEEGCQGRSCTKALPRQAGTRGWRGCCHPSQVSSRGWEFCQLSSLMLITIGSAVLLSFNLNFYPLNLFKALISHYHGTIWVSLAPPCIYSPSTPRGHAELLLCYCKTPSHGSCNVRGKVRCSIWSGYVRVCPGKLWCAQRAKERNHPKISHRKDAMFPRVLG